MGGWSGRSKGKLIRMDVYPSEYLSDPKTRGFNEEEHGVYWLLLLLGWLNGGDLPADRSELGEMLPSGPSVLERTWKKVSRCFTELNGRLFNPRQVRERKAALKVLKAKQRGGVTRSKQASRSPGGVFQDSSSQEQEQEQQQEQQQEIVHPPPPLGSGPSVEDVVACWAGECGHLPQPDRPIAAGLRDRIRSAIKRQTGRDWPKTFQRVARSDFLSGKAADFICRLYWILGPKNLAKLDSGEYDNRTDGGPVRRNGGITNRLSQSDAALEEFKRQAAVAQKAAQEEETPW